MLRKYSTIQQAKDDAFDIGAEWLAMDASGELWIGLHKPEYHETAPVWIWIDDLFPDKIGWIYPIKDWRDCRWEIG